jgi:hypothetical protein
MIANLSKRLVYACILSTQLLTYSTAFAKSGGAIAGGGGDATEERVSVIRDDLLKWISKGGAKDLNLPSAITYDQYVSKMTDILQPQEVVVGFVEKDDPLDEELMVSVDGTPKTCRGFISTRDSKAHILCNIARFKDTPDSEQYKLVHHEFAGLAIIEKNDGAASDYEVSNQITDFLSMQTVLKLAVKHEQQTSTPEFKVTKNRYIGNKKYEVEVSLKNTENVFLAILSNPGDPTGDKKILRDGKFSFKVIVDNKNALAEIYYSRVVVQYNDGNIDDLPAFNYRVPSDLLVDTSYIDNYTKNVLAYKIVSDISSQIMSHGTSVKTFTTKYAYTVDTSSLDLSQYRGVVIGNMSQGFDELLTDDPAQLEKFLKNKTLTSQMIYSQIKDSSSFGCISDVGCLYYKSFATNEFNSYSSRSFAIKFIKKDDFSSFEEARVYMKKAH